MICHRCLIYPVISVLILLCMFGCQQIPEGIEPVTGFDLNRYLGTWYEIARFDHWFERNHINTTATYSILDDGTVEVRNRGFDTDDHEWKEVRGQAFFVSTPDIGQLKVRFFWPVYGAYNIIALDMERYSWSLVCGPSLDYLWILARETELPSETIDMLIAQAESLGFKTDELLFVEQGT